ncbi:hypothetical protein SELMODRAFT_146547 [Selaginella moellendorffii]|uniref:phosphoethanolamine N-methyltransferase n=1 Tax=Selaginella moellendorffii TaxID=88036 RepID=D8REX5_SELML|nr:phosphoethanolamine N-methyltransferase 3 [Selaginella moellendorffii]EFJ29738.1 hypothetical protein SELMODRAFT_146547 [Selaginella moellendorffii]|eukprot:XP_002969650.1 phosphoethanolamine N-methyltransferase 3 [Selaginella moellendorffii]
MAAPILSTERDAQLSYWKEHSTALTVEEMLLDSQAAKLDQEERPEILSMLPPLEGISVVELGAGIGRFTGDLAKSAKHVVAMDFVQSVIDKNKEVNGCHKNVEFLCADVTSPSLTFPRSSKDLIFSNWLLMYLSDDEVTALTKKMIFWLKRGGSIFFRESCFHQSGDHKRKNNPTHYREPRFYNKIFEECYIAEEDGSYSKLQLVLFKCVSAYVKNKRNQNQICWMWKKIKCTGPDGLKFQQFLDNVQYTQRGILRYERIFGEGFVSTGGLETTKEFVESLKLEAGQKVLDVGCGIGGGDFYMAEDFDVQVVGIDLSVNMVSIALERSIGRKCFVEFEVADCTEKNFPAESFDVIYSRDTILHIQDKPALFARLLSWLKPGGKLLITDYCRSKDEVSAEFLEYIKKRGYDLHDVDHYGQMLRDAGFVDVVAEDRTDQFVRILTKELDAVERNKKSFLQDFSEEDYEDIVHGWKSKLVRCGQGHQKWGLFRATKKM